MPRSARKLLAGLVTGLAARLGLGSALGPMTGCAGATATAAATVNGPKGGFPDWDQVDWGRAEDNVRRLRRRIFAASQAGDLAKVRNRQKLMLRSRSSALVSVRRVTEINAGRRAAGVAAGDDPFALQDSAVEFSFGVAADGSISLGIDGELKDEITHTMRLTIGRPKSGVPS